MKQQPEIMESQFKEAANKIRLQPSDRAWNKLAKKLDEHQAPARRILPPWVWSVAAAMIIGLSVLWWHRPSGNELERLVHSQPPVLLEELKATGGCEPYCLMINHRNELPMDYRFPPVEAVQ